VEEKFDDILNHDSSESRKSLSIIQNSVIIGSVVDYLFDLKNYKTLKSSENHL
jgi:hypothetical protein